MQIKNATESMIQTPVTTETDSLELKSKTQPPTKSFATKDVFENKARSYELNADLDIARSIRAEDQSGNDVFVDNAALRGYLPGLGTPNGGYDGAIMGASIGAALVNIVCSPGIKSAAEGASSDNSKES